MTSTQASMRVGIQVGAFTGATERSLFREVVAVASAAEQADFEWLWLMDHFHQLPPDRSRSDPVPEAYTLLAALAQHTSRIRLGALVTGVTYRNPALLTKMITTLDMVSEGRAILGVGASWNGDEYVAYGFGDTLPTVRERVDRLEEALEVITRMLAKPDGATFDGRYYGIHDAINSPRPIQKPTIPILIGGSGEKRLLNLVARFANIWNVIAEPAVADQKLAVLKRHCASVGRNPQEIEATWLGALPLVRGHVDQARVSEEASQLCADGFTGIMYYKSKDLWSVRDIDELRGALVEISASSAVDS